MTLTGKQASDEASGEWFGQCLARCVIHRQALSEQRRARLSTAVQIKMTAGLVVAILSTSAADKGDRLP